MHFCGKGKSNILNSHLDHCYIVCLVSFLILVLNYANLKKSMCECVHVVGKIEFKIRLLPNTVPSYSNSSDLSFKANC